MTGLFSGDAAVVLAHALNVVIVVLVAVAAYLLLRAGLDRLVSTVSDGARRRPFGAVSPERLARRMATVRELGLWAGRVAISLIALLTILREFAIDVGPAIAGLGIVGIAVSLGAQSLVKDYLNGMLIVFEEQFDVGDLVRAGGVTGVVEEFSLRRTRLRTLDGVVHDVPNSAIVVVSNLTRSSVPIEVAVQVPASAVPEAASLVEAASRDLLAAQGPAGPFLDRPAVVKVGDAVADLMTLTVRARVRAADQADAAAELRRRLAEAFGDRPYRLG